MKCEQEGGGSRSEQSMICKKQSASLPTTTTTTTRRTRDAVAAADVFDGFLESLRGDVVAAQEVAAKVGVIVCGKYQMLHTGVRVLPDVLPGLCGRYECLQGPSQHLCMVRSLMGDLVLD